MAVSRPIPWSRVEAYARVEPGASGSTPPTWTINPAYVPPGEGP